MRIAAAVTVLGCLVGSACKPRNYQSVSQPANAEQSVQVCQADADDICLQRVAGKESDQALRSEKATRDDSAAIWLLFQNEDFLTLQAPEDVKQAVVLQKVGADLQRIKLISTVTEKYAKIVKGQLTWVGEEAAATDFAVRFLSQYSQTNSLR